MMNKSNSIQAIDKADLSKQTKLRLDEISKIDLELQVQVLL